MKLTDTRGLYWKGLAVAFRVLLIISGITTANTKSLLYSVGRLIFRTKGPLRKGKPVSDTSSGQWLDEDQKVQ